MICKKCGTNIADTAKFCGYCGEKIEQITNFNSVLSENNIEKNSTQSDLSQLKELNIKNAQQLNNVDEINQTIIISPVNEIKEQHSMNETKNKKNYTWLFVIGGIVLGIIILTIFLFIISKSVNNPVKKLEYALNNFEEKGENSGTIDTKILIVTDTSDSYDLFATLKYSKIHDLYNISLKLNKSLLYEEMNFYSTIDDNYITLYSKSSSIDMLGSTASTEDMWVYYLMKFDELEIEDLDLYDNIRLSDILDNNHYKYIDEENGIKHYLLTIDNGLLNKLNNVPTELIDVYYMDIYINNSNDIVKISMDLTNKIQAENIKKIVVSLEFNNFNNTLVEIPNSAKSSTMNLEKYLSTYSLIDEYNN